MQTVKNKLKSKIVYLKGILKVRFSKHIWLSLGENCLTDNILSRHNLKGFSTPYSHSRSNIDYAIALEKNNYSGLMDFDNLKYDFVSDKRVVRSTIINNSDSIYDLLHMNGFEFTHHDVKSSDIERKSLERKINRLRLIRGRKNITFLYHYRINEMMCKSEIIKKASTFSKFYSKNNKLCNIVIFTQTMVDDDLSRKVTYEGVDNIHFFELSTRYSWSGNDSNIFWAKNDDDLLKKMLSTIKSIIIDGLSVADGPLE